MKRSSAVLGNVGFAIASLTSSFWLLRVVWTGWSEAGPFVLFPPVLIVKMFESFFDPFVWWLLVVFGAAAAIGILGERFGRQEA